MVDWQAGNSQRTLEREALVLEQEECTTALERLRETIDAYPETSTQLKQAVTQSQQAVTRVVQLEAHISAHEELRGKLMNLAELQGLCDLQEQALRDRKIQLDISEHDVTKAQLALSEAIRAQLTQRVVVLAGELRDGAPCAVCGSVSHPRPAAIETGVEVVTEAQIEEIEGDLESSQAARDTHKSEFEELSSELESTKLSVASLKAICADQSQESVSAELDALNQELVTQRAVADQLEVRETELSALESAFEDSKASIVNAEKARETASNEVVKFDVQVNLKSEELSRLIDPELDAGEELNELELKTGRLITWLEASNYLDKVSQSLTPSIKELDPSECEKSVNKLEVELDSARGIVERAEETRTLSESLVKTANTLVTKFIKESQGVDELAAEVKDAVGIGALVTATSSINTKKLTLESYALQLRFTHVLESASLHLRKMSSGRLSFLLDESAQGRGNTGLGINIMDEATGDTRPTTSLSGGETFYASLSLALGLADVVQSETGGVSLETLLVDEGFGSLDTETLERVLGQLDQLKSGGRTIGVISHVSEMKDRFPDRIFVSREPEGPSQIHQG